MPFQHREQEQSDQATRVWADATKFHKTAYIPWLEYTNALEYAAQSFPFSAHRLSTRRQGDYEAARKAFTKAAKSPLDWPEMLWEAWLAFEHSHGSAREIQDALDVVERARVQVEARRAKVSLFFFEFFLTR